MKHKAHASGLDYFQEGKAEHLVVFVHGFLDAELIWDDVIAGLKLQGVETVQLDLAGMGARIHADGPIDLNRFAKDVGAVVDAINKPFVIVGQSMGAQVAEIVAAQRLDRVKGLVLLSPVPLSGVGLNSSMLNPFRSLGGQADAQATVRRQLTGSISADRFDRLVAIGLPVRPEVVAATADAWNAGHPSGNAPSTFHGPVLIARGDADDFITEEMITRAVAPRFKNAQVKTITSAGHWPHAERPEAVVNLLQEFIEPISWTVPLETGVPEVRAQGWTQAFEKKTEGSFADAFDPAVTLQASVLTKPVEGAAQVKAVMAAASKIYESLVFTQEAVNGSRSYLEWKAVAFGGKVLLGVTVLEKNADGKILNVAIHHRPLKEALQFSEALGERLRGIVDANYFYSRA